MKAPDALIPAPSLRVSIGPGERASAKTPRSAPWIDAFRAARYWNQMTTTYHTTVRFPVPPEHIGPLLDSPAGAFFEARVAQRREYDGVWIYEDDPATLASALELVFGHADEHTEEWADRFVGWLEAAGEQMSAERVRA